MSSSATQVLMAFLTRLLQCICFGHCDRRCSESQTKRTMAKDVAVAQAWVAQVEPLKAARLDTFRSTTFPPLRSLQFEIILKPVMPFPSPQPFLHPSLSRLPSATSRKSTPDSKGSPHTNYQGQPRVFCEPGLEPYLPVSDDDGTKKDTMIFSRPSNNTELFACWETFKMSGLSFKQHDERDASPVPFHPAINTHPNHGTVSHTSYSPNIDLESLTLRPSPSPSSVVDATQHISDEEYADFLKACRYPGPIHEYWEDVAQRTNRRVFECRWDGCLVFILHPPVTTGAPPDVVAHLGDHCWRSARCLWRGCKERKHVRAEDMCRHLIAHLELDGLSLPHRQ